MPEDHSISAETEFERRLIAFEEAWRAGSTPDLGAFLSPAIDSAEHGSAARRARQLLDLILMDLEYRWRAPAPGNSDSMPARPRLEHYLKRYPELGTLSHPPIELLGAEYFVRTLWGDRPDESDYLRRFPQIASLIQDELRRIENEIAREGPIRDPLTRPEGPATLEATESTSLNGSWPAIGGLEWLGEIGRGSMGVVYKARDLSLGRIVAIKTIAQGQHAEPEQRNRFQAEARAVARLRHPNIIAIHQIGEHASQPYLSLEFADGGDLDERLADKPMVPREAAELTETLARAMHVVHEAGVLHRDLKPRNVLITSDGVPKISDFGLAKLLDAGSECTASGQVVGTPSYMAPEQAEGHSKNIGPAADIYALGAILYKALTGRPPFLGSTALETLKLVGTTEVARPAQLRPDVPKDLETICLKCLQQEPSKRYSSALALATDLRQFLEGRPIEARPISPAERFRRWCRRNPKLAAAWMLLAGTVIGAISLVLGLTYQHNRALRAEVRRTGIKATEARRNYLEGRSTFQAMIKRLDDRRFDGVPQMLELRSGLLQDTLKFYDRMLALTDADDLVVRADTARAWSDASVLQSDLGHPDEAEKLARRAVDLITSVRAKAPDDSDYLDIQIYGLMRLGAYLRILGKHQDAIAAGRGSVDLVDAMASRDRSDAALEERRALCHHDCANSLLFGSKPSEAIEHYKRAIEIRQRIDPRRLPGVTHRLAQSLCNIAKIYGDYGDPAKAETEFREAEKLLRSVSADIRLPGENLELERARMYAMWSEMLQVSGRSDEAIKKANLGLARIEPYLHIEPNHATARLVCRALHGHKANAFAKEAKHALSAQEWAKVIQFTNPPVPVEYHLRIAIELAQAGQLAGARDHAENVTSSTDVGGEDCHNLACLYSLCAARARDDRALSPGEQKARADCDVQSAIRWLKAADATGLYKDVPSLRDQSRNDPDFAILRDRSEFADIFGRSVVKR
jgi:tetratricopeptide (TPR) repeat protein